MAARQGRATQLGELAHDIVVLGLLGLLVRGHDADGSSVVDLQGEAVGGSIEAHAHRHLALGTGLGQQAFELLVLIAIEAHAGTQRGRHLQRVEAIALYPIHPEAL